jgi:hypothetical protein
MPEKGTCIGIAPGETSLRYVKGERDGRHFLFRRLVGIANKIDFAKLMRGDLPPRPFGPPLLFRRGATELPENILSRISPPRVAAKPKRVERLLHLSMKRTQVLFAGIRRSPYGFSLKDDRFGEWQRNLEFIPALQLDFVFHGYVKTEDRRACLESEKYGALLGDVTRPSRSVDREPGIFSPANITHQLSEGSESSSRTGSAGHAVPETLNALGNAFAVDILTGNDDNAAITPVIRRWENAAMPESEDGAMTGLQNGIVISNPGCRQRNGGWVHEV